MKNNKITELRKEYKSQTLDIQDVKTNPVLQFGKWFEEALDTNQKEPNAMTLATASKDGIPSARIVLLKGFNEKGFIFYTNYQSKKGKELNENPYAALVFCWLELERQIRIEGKVVKTNAEISNQYFQSRPKESQIGAWASPQSKIIKGRTILEGNVIRLQKQYKNANILPRPNDWGGYILTPHCVEFWQGRPSRLHDRIQYTLLENNTWRIDRLAP